MQFGSIKEIFLNVQKKDLEVEYRFINYVLNITLKIVEYLPAEILENGNVPIFGGFESQKSERLAGTPDEQVGSVEVQTKGTKYLARNM